MIHEWANGKYGRADLTACLSLHPTLFLEFPPQLQTWLNVSNTPELPWTVTRHSEVNQHPAWFFFKPQDCNL